ncbi:MAG: DUF1800 family protein [Bacteroidota bacterium]
MASLNPHTGTLGRRLAAHLLRRTTFGYTRTEIDTFAAMSADQAVDVLMQMPAIPPDPQDPTTGLSWLPAGHTTGNSENEDLKFIVNSWWLHHVMDPALPLTIAHKLFFFLHTSFVTSFRDIEWNENHYYTLRLLMEYLEGSYKELAMKICLDNGMNDFLDISESVAGNPNENFVREFFELFTIGKGPGAGDGDYTTFTEQDVIEAARLMTGFRLNNNWDDLSMQDPDTALPRARLDVSRHDTTDKMFSPRFQNQIILGQNTQAGMLQEVQEFVDMIFNQAATAQYIVRRLYRFFVRYEINQEVETDIILPLAQTLQTLNYELVPILKLLLKSEHFYDEDDSDAGDEVIGALIKSPLDLQLGIMKYFGVPIPDPAADLFHAYVTFYQFGIQAAQTEACFDLFAPPEVAGYQPFYQAPEFNRLWISAKSIPARYAFADEHMDGPAHLQFDIMAFITDSNNISDFQGPDMLGNPGPHPGARIPLHLVSELVDYLLPESISGDRLDYFYNEVLLEQLPVEDWLYEWDDYVSTGIDTNVKRQIKRLIRAILQSPEYQLS